MEELTQEEVSSWRRDPVTQKVFARGITMIGELTEMMIDGVSDYDFTRGFIQGMGHLMAIEGDEADGNQER
jgi:hypothetical protein